MKWVHWVRWWKKEEESLSLCLTRRWLYLLLLNNWFYGNSTRLSIVKRTELLTCHSKMLNTIQNNRTVSVICRFGCRTTATLSRTFFTEICKSKGFQCFCLSFNQLLNWKYFIISNHSKSIQFQLDFLCCRLPVAFSHSTAN